MATTVNLKSKKALRAIKKINRDYRPQFQGVIETMLDEIRFEAIRFIIPNSTPFRNPKMASRAQRSTPGKLTERTGKLIFMLKHKATPFGEGFTGNRSRVKKTAALKMTVTAAREGSTLEAYKGKILFEFSGHGRLTSVGDKRPKQVGDKKSFPKLMPRETAQTLFFRFIHDLRGLKGQSKRPFLTPAAKQNERNMRTLANQRMVELVRRL